MLAAGERRGAVLECLKETMSARRTPCLGDDGPFREPDRSSACNDGRARAVTAGELPEPEDEARAYLEAEPGNFGVFRRPDCKVRVAQEADLCRRPSLTRGVLAATFTRTFNMLQVEGSVCCCRCGLAPFCPVLLTSTSWRATRSRTTST